MLYFQHNNEVKKSIDIWTNASHKNSTFMKYMVLFFFTFFLCVPILISTFLAVFKEKETRIIFQILKIYSFTYMHILRWGSLHGKRAPKNFLPLRLHSNFHDIFIVRSYGELQIFSCIGPLLGSLSANLQKWPKKDSFLKVA